MSLNCNGFMLIQEKNEFYHSSCLFVTELQEIYKMES